MPWTDYFAGLGGRILLALGLRQEWRAPDMPRLPAAVLQELPPDGMSAPLAPSPLTDRYPVIVGAGTTLAYASSVLRLAITGYRREYVDFLRELLERAGTIKALVSGRVTTIAGGRLEIAPCELPADHPEEALAKEIAEYCRKKVLAIPDLRQSLANLGWGSFYGVSAAETGWAQEYADVATMADGSSVQALRWYPERLYSIANRRLNYPDPQSWDLHVWDQGQVLGPSKPFGQPTNGPAFGLSVRNFPGKFIVHTPQYAADYPTREGWGRELIWLMCFKSLGLRLGANFLERFSRIITWATFSTQDDGQPREANQPDIDQAASALQTLGAGSLTAAVLPDCIQIHQEGPGTKAGKGPDVAIESWIRLIDAQAAVVVRGTTFTTEPGKFGTKGTSGSGELAESESERFDAAVLAETLRRDLVSWIVRLNWPRHMHLVPKVSIHLEDPKPAEILELAVKAAANGVPVDADDVAEKIGLRVVPNKSGEPRRMAPLAPVAIPPTMLGSDVAEHVEEASKKALEIAQATKPKQLPGDKNATTDKEPPAKAAE